MRFINKKFFILVLLIMFGVNVPVYSSDNINTEWQKYFTKYSHKLRKNWKKNKQLYNNKNYNTSYARVLFKVDKNGKILSYDIKSSCVPFNDTIFIEKVKQTIDLAGKPAPLPAIYKDDDVEFTIKFHIHLPDQINTQNIDWIRYGIADVELDNRKAKIILVTGDKK